MGIINLKNKIFIIIEEKKSDCTHCMELTVKSINWTGHRLVDTIQQIEKNTIS